MAQGKWLLRILVPVVILAAGVAIMIGGIWSRPSAPTPSPTSAAPQSPTASTTGQASSTTTQSAATTTPAAATPATPIPAPVAPIAGLRAQVVEQAALTPIGALSRERKAEPTAVLMRIDFDPHGAGIKELSLAHQFLTVDKDAPNQPLQRTENFTVNLTDGSSVTQQLVPMAILVVEINGSRVDLTDLSAGPIWKELAPGKFLCTIVDAEAKPIAKIERQYVLEPGRYDVAIKQTIANLGATPINVRWIGTGPVDLPIGKITYGGDLRRVRVGYLPPVGSNPDLQVVAADRFLMTHADALSKPVLNDAGALAFPRRDVWPPKDVEAGLSLVWAGLTNRFFAVSVFPLVDAQPKLQTGVPDKALRAVATIDRVVLDRGYAEADSSARLEKALMALRLTSPSATLAPGATLDSSVGLYAGPLDTKPLNASPATKLAGLDKLVIYTMGGPCAFCTFQPVAGFLHWLMVSLHDYITRDWALAVILLVVCVRTILHPVTRWSQTNLQRFGKQMSALGPKQAKIKEKYANDSAKQREELARLMREENINYAGALGCVPMFLQMPVWIALYAMVMFSFEIRHQAGFYGVFQAISGGNWSFLADMSLPDRFISLGSGFDIPWIGRMIGTIEGINVLPLILGVVFWIQQKYLTPPTTTQLTPEQESTQKITKVMMVVMFPVFMYNAPAALSLYFLTNSTLGIFESKWIRERVEKQDAIEKAEREARGPRAKDEPKKAKGFFAKLQERAEAYQKQMEDVRKQQAKDKKRK
jgi:YidC/Oxa1 family membrane protein insertase